MKSIETNIIPKIKLLLARKNIRFIKQSYWKCYFLNKLNLQTCYKNVIYVTGVKYDTMDVISAYDMQGNLLWDKAYSRADKGTYKDSRGTELSLSP